MADHWRAIEKYADWHSTRYLIRYLRCEWFNPQSPVGRYPLHHVPSAHLCFDVEDIEATYEHLKEEGVEFVSPPVYWEASEGGWIVLFFYDPDGNLLELNQPQPQNQHPEPHA